MDEYLLALAKGDSLSDAEHNKIIEKLANYTSLPKTYIRKSNLRIRRDDFVKELLRSENRRIGVLDSRVIGISKFNDLMDDPSMFEVTGPLVGTWNEYVRNELKYENDLPYKFLSMEVNRSWNWSSDTGGLGYVNVGNTLKQAMSENKYLKIFMASGYYDLDTPYFATKYVVNHLGLDLSLRDNITVTYYDAGHQMYTHLPSLKKLKVDVGGFFKKVSPN
jgi:carboxypeptidase C (cathepsin A)